MTKKFFFFALFFTCSLSANSTFFDNVDEASIWLEKHVNTRPELLVVLTAGIEGLEDSLRDKVVVSCKEIPHFPQAHAQGHAGQLIFGTFDGRPVVLMKGRYHFYEGIEPQDVVFPYFVLSKLGVNKMITTNAVGGIRNDLNAGDIVLIKDHINYMSANPLRGIATQFPEHQFTDMTAPYDAHLAQTAKEVAQALHLPLKEGVYVATMGPNYETKSEIRMFRSFGADVVGMSTVFEVIACNFLKIQILAFSCVCNPAADRHAGNMNHEEVLAAMKQMGPNLLMLIEGCILAIESD
jgi:purine-nucleoside phosphorylase